MKNLFFMLAFGLLSTLTFANEKTNESAIKDGLQLTETLPVIAWEIKPEYKTLSDLRCQKAVGYFRGRTYKVWFTEASPLNLGPWKLQGLSGLILRS